MANKLITVNGKPLAVSSNTVINWNGDATGKESIYPFFAGYTMVKVSSNVPTLAQLQSAQYKTSNGQQYIPFGSGSVMKFSDYLDLVDGSVIFGDGDKLLFAAGDGCIVLVSESTQEISYSAFESEIIETISVTPGIYFSKDSLNNYTASLSYGSGATKLLSKTV